MVGAGTMGAGIAQIAAVAGYRVLIADAAPGLAACDLVIEAVIEDTEVKRRLLAELEQVTGPDCVLATNTSSLSVTALAAGLEHPGRLVGLHFFNPVPVMRLVEVVSGLATTAETASRAASLASGWGKTVVRSADTPVFIVNRIARPFYAEAWRLAEEQAAEPAVIDAVLTGAGGFRMGPFALMDLIGHDVNEARLVAASPTEPSTCPAVPCSRGATASPPPPRRPPSATRSSSWTGSSTRPSRPPSRSPRPTATRPRPCRRRSACSRRRT